MDLKEASTFFALQMRTASGSAAGSNASTRAGPGASRSNQVAGRIPFAHPIQSTISRLPGILELEPCAFAMRIVLCTRSHLASDAGGLVRKPNSSACFLNSTMQNMMWNPSMRRFLESVPTSCVSGMLHQCREFSDAYMKHDHKLLAHATNTLMQSVGRHITSSLFARAGQNDPHELFTFIIAQFSAEAAGHGLHESTQETFYCSYRMLQERACHPGVPSAASTDFFAALSLTLRIDRHRDGATHRTVEEALRASFKSTVEGSDTEVNCTLCLQSNIGHMTQTMVIDKVCLDPFIVSVSRLAVLPECAGAECLCHSFETFRRLVTHHQDTSPR